MGQHGIHGVKLNGEDVSLYGIRIKLNQLVVRKCPYCDYLTKKVTWIRYEEITPYVFRKRTILSKGLRFIQAGCLSGHAMSSIRASKGLHCTLILKSHVCNVNVTVSRVDFDADVKQRAIALVAMQATKCFKRSCSNCNLLRGRP